MLSQLYIAENTFAVKVINDKFILTQSEMIISLIQITNLESPILLEYTKIIYDNPGYRSILTKDSKYLILPTMEVIGLYTSDTKLYTFIKMSNFNSKKKYDISIWGLSLQTGNSISNLFKSLQIVIKPNPPPWVSFDINSRIITLLPTDINDLMTFTKLVISVTISRQIDTRLFFDDEITSLRSMGLLDTEDYPTLKYNPNSVALTPNEINVFSSHFFVNP